MSQRKKKVARRRAFWLVAASLILSGTIYVIGTGRWVSVYAFFAQFHQRILWAALLFLFVPFLLIVFLRAWGVEDLPYVEAVPELGTGRLGALADRLRRARRSAYDQALLINELAELATEVIALNEGVGPAVARRLCRSGRWSGDETILDLVVYNRMPDGSDAQFLQQFERVLGTIERMLKGGTKIEPRPSR
jgi:hypothetical protein